jgi:hypothetical protein
LGVDCERNSFADRPQQNFKYAFSMLFLFLYTVQQKISYTLIQYKADSDNTCYRVEVLASRSAVGNVIPTVGVNGQGSRIIMSKVQTHAFRLSTRRPFHTNRVGVNTLPVKKYRSICWYVTISHYPFHCPIFVSRPFTGVYTSTTLPEPMHDVLCTIRIVLNFI